MRKIDLSEMIKDLKLDEILCKAFAEKSNVSESDYKKLFNHILEREINNIGESMHASKNNPKDTSRLQGLSLDDFMKDNDKIIKDK